MKLYYVLLTLLITISTHIQPCARELRQIRDQKRAEELCRERSAASKLGLYTHYLEKRAKSWELYNTMREHYTKYGFHDTRTFLAIANYQHFLTEHQPLFNQWQEYDMHRRNTALFRYPEIEIVPPTPRTHLSQDH